MRQPLGVRAALERAVPAADGGQVPVALGLGTGCGAITALAADVAGFQRHVGGRHDHRRGHRVVMAYTMPADEVPGLGTGLVLVTSMVLIVVTNVYYIVCGVSDRSSRLYRAEGELTGATR